MNDYKEFNELYGLKTKQLNYDQALTTAKLIVDEVNEFLAEFFTGTEFSLSTATDNRQIPWPEIKHAAKELTDIRYITGQQMAEYGMDVGKLDAEVHRSNMSKSVCIDDITAELFFAKKRYPEAVIAENNGGYVMKCADTGKVIKPSTYSPAVITPDMWGEYE